MNTNENPQRLYWPQLDGLRFLAMLLVLIHHSRVPEFLNPIKEIGWAGVDLFLVLSAFLLTSLLRREHQLTNTINLKSYFARRALRIWPLYFGFVSFSLIWVIVDGGYRPEHFGMYLSHLTFTNNIMAGLSGYDYSLPYSPHLWTLSLEEQFYIALPFLIPTLVAITAPNCKKNYIIFAAMLFLIAVRTACYLMKINHNFVWTSPIRCDAFVLGMAFSVSAVNTNTISQKGNLFFALGLLLLFSSPLLIGSPFGNYIATYTLVDLGCLLMVMGTVTGSSINKFLGCMPIRYLGKISFGIYVFHWFAICIARNIADKTETVGTISELFVGIILSLIFGIASFELFEKHFLRLKNRFEIIKNRPI